MIMNVFAKYILFLVSIIIGIAFSVSQSYAATFSQELNTSTWKLFPIKNNLNSTVICNPTYAGSSCYEQSMNHGWYVWIVNTTISVPSVLTFYTETPDYSSTVQDKAGTVNIIIDIPEILTFYTETPDYSSTIQDKAGTVNTAIEVPTILAFYAETPDYSYTFQDKAGTIWVEIALPEWLTLFEVTELPSVFQWKWIYKKESKDIALNIIWSKLSEGEKNSLLYASWGVFTASWTTEVSFYTNSSVPTFNPTTYNIYKIKINKYTIIVKELKTE